MTSASDEAAPQTGRGRPRAREIALVALGGAIGAVLRIAFVTAFPTADGAVPWVTLTENLVGAWLLAVLLTVLGRRAVRNPTIRLLVGTGILGSFTTYSTHSVELVRLADHGTWGVAGLYLTLTIGGGLAAAAAGVWVGHRLTPEAGR